MDGCNWPPGCDREIRRMTRGMCHYHYKKALASGVLKKRPEMTWQDRFYSYVNKRGGFPDFTDPYVRVTSRDGECWIWTGALWGGGYGRLKIDGRLRMAHRLSLSISGADVPDALDVDHLCRRPTCVNPDHLEPVTRSENTLRGRSAEVSRSRRKPFCLKGHPLTEENVLDYGDGRKCRTCQNDKNREWMRAHRAHPRA